METGISRVRINFSNPILLGIWEKYILNDTMALFVTEKGETELELESEQEIIPPKSCEDVLSMLLRLLDENPEGVAGEAFAACSADIYRDILFNLSQILEGFGSVKMTIETSSQNEENQTVTKKTEFTLSRTKSVNSQ